MDNEHRRAFAAEAIATYRKRRAFSNDPGYRDEPDEAVIGDMLTDLTTLLRRERYRFRGEDHQLRSRL